MQRFCLTLKLRPDPALIAQYIQHHQHVWPEVRKSLRDAGVLDMQIFLNGAQLFMIMDTTDDFTPERKSAMDSSNPRVLEWETLMANFQDVDANSNPTTRWQPMEKVFQLS